MVSATRTGARLACAVAATLMVAAVGTAQAITSRAVTRAATVRIGRLPNALQGATVVGQLAPSTRLHVTVTLKPRDPAALNVYAQAVATPGSSVYHEYLTPSQFARRFGASPAEVRAVREGLEARGLRPGRLSAGALSIPVTATAAALDRGFSLSLRHVALRNGRRAIAASAAPGLGASAAAGVQAVVGLNSLAAPRPLLVRAHPAVRRRVPLAEHHLATGGPQACADAQSTANSQGAYTADQIASAYGFSGLYGSGDFGAGTTVAVYELEPVSPTDLATYQSCYGTHTSISYVKVDGGAGTGSGSGESALDIENLIGLAPDAKVIVYEGQNSPSGSPGSGPYDTFKTIIDDDKAQVVSVSWGECEQALGSADAAAENTLFEQAAVQGQTIVSAGGDSGSEDCFSDTTAQTQLAVDDPASQPYVIGVGGTTLSALGPRPMESVWNSGGNLASALVQPGAGGGGISSLWQMPASQRSAASSLNVLAQGITGAQCGDPGGYCREVPDVAADADPSTGYVIYWTAATSGPGQQSGWQAIGGTSAAAPVWAALIALTDSSHGCASDGPLGYALPALYRAASHSYASDFNDVGTGNNDFTGSSGGLYAAAPGYDEASGLGSPNGASLAASLCPNTLRIKPPNDQRSAAQAAASLRLRATDVAGAVVSFRAVGLPSGLSVNQSTGRISGRARHSGTFHVTAAAFDPEGSVAASRFTWTVGGAARVLASSLTGISARKPRLAFTVTAGRGSPALEDLTVTIPKDLTLGTTRGLTVTTHGKTRPRFSAHASHGTLQIRLRRALGRVRITLSYPALRVAARRPNAAGRAGLELLVNVTDASNDASRIRAHV